MDLDHQSIMELIRKDTYKATHDVKPTYMVSSGKVSMPFTNEHLAFYWHKYMEIQGVETVIYELKNYDWETNLANIKFHDTSTPDGQKDLFQTISGKSVIN
ncbi:MAG: hypothetical protein Q8911_00135 [Bacillota bacterium]|nr:hypothetical protein [Bacillota bacterium]